MRFYQYKNYDDYIERQKKYYDLKVDFGYWVWKDTIEKIVHDSPHAENVLCHGTRNGKEQKHFVEFLPDSYIIGSEIGDGCEQFPMTVQWDFNQFNPDWFGKFDIVYSNSFDHCITPKQTLKVWRDQLSENGRLYLELADRMGEANPSESDPFCAAHEEIIDLIKDIGMQMVCEIKHKPDNSRLYCFEK